MKQQKDLAVFKKHTKLSVHCSIDSSKKVIMFESMPHSKQEIWMDKIRSKETRRNNKKNKKWQGRRKNN